VWNIFCSFRSYSNTRTVAPTTTRSYRSPGATLKTSDTNISSVDSTRHHTRPIGISTTTNQPTTTITTGTTDATTNDVYQQVYHDDSSTHGSRTLDSRFSRDKYDLSDEQNTDEDEDEHIQKPTNGLSSVSPTHVYRSSEPFQVNDNHISQIQHPMDQVDKGKSLKKSHSKSSPQLENPITTKSLSLLLLIYNLVHLMSSYCQI
jgi:hypothetical protein